MEAVVPGRASNPSNVKLVELILSEKLFRSLFPRAHSSYTYTNLLKAVAKFPAVCVGEQVCRCFLLCMWLRMKTTIIVNSLRRILANMFGHFQQETAGLVYLREINKSGYCAAWSPW